MSPRPKVLVSGCHGRVTSGCGGGYIVMATEEEIPGGFHPQVRRSLSP